MAVLALVATQLVIAAALNQAPPGGLAATSLRGSEANPSSDLKVSSPTFTDERGERGHFYYADACEDCFYKGAQCGCQPAVEYLACLTKHCFSSNRTRFANKCGVLSNNCAPELDIACNGPDTICKSKFNQLDNGGLGLTLDLAAMNDDAYCGPFGKCIGSVHMKVVVHHPAQQSTFPVVSGAPGPAPVMAASPMAAPAPGPAPAPAAPPSLWVECGLPAVANASMTVAADWVLCRAEVVGDKAGCDIPMTPKLKPGEGQKAYCVLTEAVAADGSVNRLSAPAWHLITSVHVMGAETKKAAEPANDSGDHWWTPSWMRSAGTDSRWTLPWMHKKNEESQPAE